MDSEIRSIDHLEDQLKPLDPKVYSIRELISCLELCHHKAERWVLNIIEAIGTGESNKGMGTRSPDQLHPVEAVWKEVSVALLSWCDADQESGRELKIDSLPASRWLDVLGDLSSLKKWQVQRVVDKIESFLRPSKETDSPMSPYEWLLLGGDEYELTYREDCPERYKENESFWIQTARTIIHDTETGKPAQLSLALAIDMLMPCHWAFLENLRIVLAAIGGELHPATPYAACGRNIEQVPSRKYMENVSNTLRSFGNMENREDDTDSEILSILGEPSETKVWLVRSLDKTIRLQLHPSNEIRAISALTGPEWIQSHSV